MKFLAFTAMVCVVALAGCRSTDSSAVATAQCTTTWTTPTLALDLSQLDENGLRGPADGKVSVAYEFVIPDTDAAKAEVHAIDPTIKFHPGSRGRIGAGAGEILCIGETNENYRIVLPALANLPYVERIQECYFE